MTKAMRVRWLLGLLVLPIGNARAARIQGHALYADDGAKVETTEPVHFAVVGNVRPALPLDKAAGRTGPAMPDAVVKDIAAHKELDAVVLLGDVVTSGSIQAWRAFDRRFAGLLQKVKVTKAPPPAPEEHLDLQGVVTVGAPPPEPTVTAIGDGRPAVPVAGDREARGDPRFKNWNAAFPNIGRFIGYNRVASWYRFDVVSTSSGGQRFIWRFVVLDSGKARLGSRWKEQLNWIPTAVAGDYDAMVLLMHDSVIDLAGKKLEMNPDGAPAELVSAVDDAIGMLKLRAVFTAGHDASEAFLPDGPYGELYVVAGGGGAPTEDLRRWGPLDQAGRDQDIHLESSFDLALLDAVDRWNRIAPLPESVLDEAKAMGSFKGFTGTYDGTQIPTTGWWKVSLDGPRMDVDFYLRRPADGKFEHIYRATLDHGPEQRGAWQASHLQVEPPRAPKEQPIGDLDE